MPEPDDIRAIVQDAIDKGATSVEEVHKQIARMPLDALSQLEPLQGQVETAKALTETAIGTVYDTIRRVNEQAGAIASQMLGGASSGDDAG